MGWGGGGGGGGGHFRSKKGGFQNLQDSEEPPFGLWRVKFSRGVWISKKEKPSSGI